MPNRSELREQVFGRARGGCEWSRCTSRAEHLAHIQGIGRGGNPDGTRDAPMNCLALCVFHHDVLDGRVMAGRAKEVEYLLLELNARRHPESGDPIDQEVWPI